MLNKVILMGRLTKDPELKTTQSNIASCNFTLAADRRFQKQGEQRQADFINCVAWRQTAEFISKYFKKGSMIAVVGEITTGSYDKDGQKVFTTKVTVHEVSFTGEKKSEQGEPQAQAQSEFRTPWDDFEAFTPVEADEDLPF